MEFFDWLSVPQFFLEYFFQSFLPDTGEITREDVAAAVMRGNYISVAVAGGMFLILLLFGGFGLCRMAKKAGKKPSVLAFLPFANTYYTGKLAGEASFFGQKMKRAGLYAMIAELFYSALEAFRLVLTFLLTRPEYFSQVKAEGSESIAWQIDRTAIPESLRWQFDALDYSGIVSYVLIFVMIIFLFTLYIALFRKYYARGPVLMVLLCTVFPFRGFVLFAVRNNTPVDYNAYMRRRAEEMSRRYYGDQTPPPPPPPASPSDQDPFSEFGGRDDSDPFDFDHKN